MIWFFFFLMFLLFSCCHVQLFVTPWTAAHQVSPSFTISQSLLKFMSIEPVMPSKHSSSVASSSSCPQSFPASGSFSMSQLFTSGGQSLGASLMAQMVKNLPVMKHTLDMNSILGLGKSSGEGNGILAWRIPWTEEPGGLQSMWSQRAGHNWTSTNWFNVKRENVFQIYSFKDGLIEMIDKYDSYVTDAYVAPMCHLSWQSLSFL